MTTQSLELLNSPVRQTQANNADYLYRVDLRMCAEYPFGVMMDGQFILDYIDEIDEIAGIEWDMSMSSFNLTRTFLNPKFDRIVMFKYEKHTVAFKLSFL